MFFALKAVFKMNGIVDNVWDKRLKTGLYMCELMYGCVGKALK